MPGWLRRAGHGRAGDGAQVIWSVAEGHRGRRWREVVVAGEGIRTSLLLELDPDGQFGHLELSTAAGLLTLHPEPDGTIHGNAVTAAGIEHIAGWPWARDRAVEVVGSVVCLAAGRRPDHTNAVEWLRIGIDLALDPIVRTVPAGWRDIDAEGLPTLLDGVIWPLEEPS